MLRGIVHRCRKTCASAHEAVMQHACTVRGQPRRDSGLRTTKDT
jgi:hypothetical protein